MPKPTMAPKHCFHETGEQRDPGSRCCFCNIEQKTYDKTGHGRYYVGSGDLVDNTAKDCPLRLNRWDDQGR